MSAQTRAQSDEDGDDPSIGLGSGPEDWSHERVVISDVPRVSHKDRQPFVIEPHPARASYGGSAAPLMRQDSEDGFLARMGRTIVALVLVLLIFVLLAQLVYIYRSQISLSFPTLRPMIERACKPLGCQVPFARDLAQLSISGSALRADATQQAQDGPPAATDATQAAPRHFILNVNLRNLGELPQEWPTIVLDLNDASGARLVRSNLDSRDYLTPQQLEGPFAPHSDVLVRVPLTVTGVEVNGYQLDLFFP